MLLRLAFKSSCFCRNSHMLAKFGRVKPFRFQDIAVDNKYHQISTLCNAHVESRNIRGSSKLLAIHTWRINDVSTRNFMPFDPDLKPVLRSNPNKDGLPQEKYELMYTNDPMLVYQRSIHMVILLVILVSPYICYQVYTDPETKDLNIRKPLDNSEKYLNLFAAVLFFSVTLGIASKFGRSPYRLYKERTSHGLEPRFLAILPHRIFYTKQLEFGRQEYKEAPKPHNLFSSLLFGNAAIKNKGYLIFEDCFLSLHYHNELNGFTL